jgi:hypothetical protein
MTGLPPRRCAIPGPLVETGSLVARVCEVEIPEAETFGATAGEGDGDGEGDGVGEGGASVITAGVMLTGTTAFEFGVAADVRRARKPM